MSLLTESLLSPQTILSYRDELRKLREILLANVVMAGEIPAPTGYEGRLTRFLGDRFIESGLEIIAEDEAGNVAAILPGRIGTRDIVVAAHLDKIWADSEDHTVSVGADQMSGRGLADNSLGVAVLATMPFILERLGIKFDSNLILLGTSRSFGRGNLRGMRYFLEHTDREISSALCLEGIELGRLSFSSLGMARGEILVELSGLGQTIEESTVGVLAVLQRLISGILEINRRESPVTRILVGTVEADSGFNVPPRFGVLRFEIRSEDAARVAAVEAEIVQLAEAESTRGEFPAARARVEIIAQREPGNLGENHPLTLEARRVLQTLGVTPHEEPSISELAALLDQGIPALTLGITRGRDRHTPIESIRLEPIFDGLAQVVSLLQFMDAGLDAA